MGCLVEIRFKPDLDGKKRTAFGRKHKRFFDTADRVSMDLGGESDGIAERWYTRLNEEATSLLLVEYIGNDYRVASVKIVS